MVDKKLAIDENYKRKFELEEDEVEERDDPDNEKFRRNGFKAPSLVDFKKAVDAIKSYADEEAIAKAFDEGRKVEEEIDIVMNETIDELDDLAKQLSKDKLLKKFLKLDPKWEKHNTAALKGEAK